MITKTAEQMCKEAYVMGHSIPRSMRDVSRLEDNNAIQGYKEDLKEKSEEDNTASLKAGGTGAALGGGYGLLASLASKGALGKGKASAIGAGLGLGTGLLAKFVDDSWIEESKKKKDAPDSELLRDLGKFRSQSRNQDRRRQAAMNSLYRGMV